VKVTALDLACHLAALAADHGGLEVVCARCGRCCYDLAEDGGRLVRGLTPCEHLAEDGSCAVYARRRSVPHCTTIPDAIRRGLLPSDCPYVTGLDGYEGPEGD
jgi:uncharacterized cysteine cluster protein YcgN (CxxCxxCC family)